MFCLRLDQYEKKGKLEKLYCNVVGSRSCPLLDASRGLRQKKSRNLISYEALTSQKRDHVDIEEILSELQCLTCNPPLYMS